MKRTALQRRTPLQRKTPLRSKGKTNSKRRRYSAYLQSAPWRKLKRLVLERDGYRCFFCLRATNLEVHHIHYETFGKETGEELVTLCKRHHEREHRIGLARRLPLWRDLHLAPVRKAS